MTKQLHLNGSAIHDIASFHEEVNRVFMADEAWKLGQSLDAFDDLLYGGFGALSGSETTDLIWHDIEVSRRALGYETTRSYYQEKLRPDSPFNQTHFRDKLLALDNGTGETYFDILMTIISEHPAITLIAA